MRFKLMTDGAIEIEGTAMELHAMIRGFLMAVSERGVPVESTILTPEAVVPIRITCNDV